MSYLFTTYFSSILDLIKLESKLITSDNSLSLLVYDKYTLDLYALEFLLSNRLFTCVREQISQVSPYCGPVID